MLAPRGRRRNATGARPKPAMAIYHATVKAFSRGQGHSGTAAAAYRAGIAIADERTEVRHDYTRRRGVASVDMLAPAGAPEWARDPAACFNRSELGEVRANARVGREVEVALPAELDAEQRHALAVDLGQLLVDRYEVAVLVAVHKPDKGGDERNHHCHLLMTPRQIGPDGLGNRACAEFDAREGVGPNAVRALREAVAGRINEHLARAKVADRVDHRTLFKQAEAAETEGRIGFAAALTREPTSHEGKAATAMRRRGEPSDRTAANDAIEGANRIELQSFLRLLEKEGRLMETPPQHSQEAARAERAPTITPARATAASRPAHPTNAPRPTKLGNAGRNARPNVSGRSRAGPVRLARLAGTGADVQSANERIAVIEGHLAAAMAAAEQWLAAIERTAHDSADSVARIMRACDPARIQAHARVPSFVSVAAQLANDTRQAAQDDTRWSRRRDAYERAKHALDDAKREQATSDSADLQPSFWAGPISRREWAERRRKRAARVDKARSRRNTARDGVGPEAQVKYSQQAQASMERLEITLATMEARYPLSIDQAGALPRGPAQQPTPAPGRTSGMENENGQQGSRRGATLPPSRPRLR